MTKYSPYLNILFFGIIDAILHDLHCDVFILHPFQILKLYLGLEKKINFR